MYIFRFVYLVKDGKIFLNIVLFSVVLENVYLEYINDYCYVNSFLKIDCFRGVNILVEILESLNIIFKLLFGWY